jgi:hypothetical protein
MAVNLYVMPITGAGVKGDPRRPKYKDSLFPAQTFDADMWDYGDEPWCLVGIVDVSPAADTALRANADVFALPQNLDTTVGSVGTRNQIRTQLETAEIPGQWVQTTSTYRQIVRMVGGCCRFAQRYQGMVGGVLFPGATTLDSTFGSLPQAQQTGMLDTAAWFGMTTTTWTAAATLRTVMQSASDQYVAAHALSLAGVAL